ncbi:MAG: hypothetical protein AB3N23_08950 [Paracoccaceae bacterium]
MRIQYLEVVTLEVDATCKALSTQHGADFAAPEPALGSARVARLQDGGRIGVRPPLRGDEAPVVRPYLGVPDIGVAITAAEQSGAMIAMPATEIPGQGTFAIYILGGVEFGLWET